MSARTSQRYEGYAKVAVTTDVDKVLSTDELLNLEEVAANAETAGAIWADLSAICATECATHRILCNRTCTAPFKTRHVGPAVTLLRFLG